MDKQAFFAANKPRVTAKEVPEAGGTFHFQEFSGATFDAYITRAQGDTAPNAYPLSLVMAAMVSEDGTPYFDAADETALRSIPNRVLSALASAAAEVNKLGATAEEEAAKN